MNTKSNQNKEKEIIELLEELDNYLKEGKISIKYNQCGSKCCTCKYKEEPIIWALKYKGKQINLKDCLKRQESLSRNVFEFVLNGKNWKGAEATLTLWICPAPSLKKCDECGKMEKNIMSSSLKGDSWGGSWLNYCRECSFKRLEELKTSGFLEEIKLLLEIEKFIKTK